jgi:hypothetical protein
VVDEAARAGDHHVEAALERGLLDRHVDAAEGGADVQAGELRVDAQVLGHLDAQLARRDDDHAAQAGLAAAQLVEHRQAEGGGLAAARLAQADQLGAGEDLGDRVRLDLGRGVVARGAHAAEDGLLEPEGSETHVVGARSRRRAVGQRAHGWCRCDECAASRGPGGRRMSTARRKGVAFAEHAVHLHGLPWHRRLRVPT